MVDFKMSAIFYIILISSGCLAQQQLHQQQHQQGEESTSLRPVRAPQGHLQYVDPDGLKVSWKLYTPYTSQWTPVQPARTQRAESDTAQPTSIYQTDLIRPVAATPAPTVTPAPQQEKPAKAVQQVQIQYKPYEMVPSHIKELLTHMYQPQVPYVDPAVYVYQAQLRQQQEELERQKQAEAERERQQQQYQQPQPNYDQFFSKYYPKKYVAKTKLGYAPYKEEQPAPAASNSGLQYGAVLSRYNREQQQEQERKSEDIVMPREIYQLLNLQAQTPYHVIANGIVYKPKTIFIPKPLPEDGKTQGYKYRSKVYFLKDLEEDQNKERPEPRELEPAE